MSRRAYVCVAFLAMALCGASVAWAAVGDSGPSIASELADYNPGQTVTLTGSGWDTGGTQVHIIVNDDEGQTWSHVADVTPSADGTVTDSFELPTWFVAVYSVVATQTTETGTLTATSSFTDANPSADLDQCANDPAPSPSSDGCSGSATDWVNGNLGASKAVYFEGDSVPYRMRFDNLSLASHTVVIEWDTTKSGKHALDYLTSFDRTVTTANPLLGVSGVSGPPSTFPIPADPQVTGAAVTPVGGNFKMYGAAITSVSAYSYPDGTGFAGDKSARIAVTFTPTTVNPVLAWAGHVSSRADWGANNSAVAISGSPYHMRLINLDGSGGNQDRSLSADAVIFPGSLTVVKDATPNGSTSFAFTGSPAPLTNFSLVDDGTSANTKTFGSITAFQTYTVNETPIPADWGFDSAACTVSSPNGGSYATSTTTVNVALKEGENWTCTYQDSIRVGTLVVKKHVENDNGGSAVASDWQLHAKSGANEVSGSPAAGSEAGKSYTLSGGSYTVSETGGPSGYTQTSISGDCASDGTVTVVAGQTKTCTITNDDVAPKLHLRKVLVNDNGGSATVADFTLTADGTKAGNDLSGPDPVDSTGSLKADTWTLSETTMAGYSASDWACVGGTQGTGADKDKITVGIAGEATCTISNDDVAPKLHLRKVVVTDNGGTATVANFTLTADGTKANNDLSGTSPVNSGTGLKADTWALSETTMSGYSASDWTCVGGTQGTGADKDKITVGIGGEATCTITNDDIAPTLIVKKRVVNDNAGTAVAANWTLHVRATGALVDFASDFGSETGTTYHPPAGSYDISETGGPSGYAQTSIGDDCDALGNVTLAVGDTKTCTITNDDVAPKLHLRKVVVNDNGGSATVADFTLTADGAKVGNDLSGTDPVNSTGSLKADTWALSETTMAGYSASDWACVGGSQNGDEITVGIGGEATCTITNDDVAPKLHLRKVVVTDNGGTATVANFTLTADGTKANNDLSGTSPVDSGAGLKADTWTLSETTVAGYTASDWVCVGGTQGTGADKNKITVGNGGEATCTITNDDQPGKIVIIKNAKPASGTFSFTTTGTAYGGFTLNGDPTGGANSNTQTLNAGTYTVKETTQLGWMLTGIGGSSDPSTPYACVTTGAGGSTGSGSLDTQTATVTLKIGDTVTCSFENTGNGATRTQGFWATHPQLAQIAWDGGSRFGHTFPGVGATPGIMDRLICAKTVTAVMSPASNQVMGGFWSGISSMTTNKKRSSLGQNRMQLLQQLLAAELNASAFGSVPAGGTAAFAQWEAALCGTNITAIGNAQQQAGSFNSAGDSSTFTPGTSADSKNARLWADMKFWDVFN
jgi:hypothetical protein